MKKKISTKSIHGKKLYAYKGPVVNPIYQTSNFRFENSTDAVKYSKGDKSVYIYSRYQNPTVEDVEEKIALMYDADEAVLYSSGMGAISTLIQTFVNNGFNVVSSNSLYGGTYRYLRDVAPNLGITSKFFDGQNLSTLSNLINEKTKLVYFETPTNPILEILDIKKIVKIVKDSEKKFGTKILTAIDNTFASVLNQNPLKMGMDIVIESGTKYLAGHSDLLAGVIISNKKNINKIRASGKYFGPSADPFMAFLMSRSLKTFSLRVEKQNINAFEIAKALEGNKKILNVIYPGLKSHKQHSLAKKQMKSFGAIVTIDLKGGVKSAIKFCDNLKIGVNAMSLGGVETLVSIPVYSTHVNLSKEELNHHRVTEGMVRISVGVEDVNDLINDFNQALQKV